MTELGTVLDGKYEILKKVGQGGMSIVYLAMDNRLNKQWAVKEIKNDGSKSVETLLKGLEREANILKNVDHPVLPRIVDIINENGTIYVIMDFVEGKPLNEVLKARQHRFRTLTQHPYLCCRQRRQQWDLSGASALCFRRRLQTRWYGRNCPRFLKRCCHCRLSLTVSLTRLKLPQAFFSLKKSFHFS